MMKGKGKKKMEKKASVDRQMEKKPIDVVGGGVYWYYFQVMWTTH